MGRPERRPRDERAAAADADPQGADGRVRCPFCGSQETELYSLFGSQLSTSQYYCRRCRVAFEALKWES